MNLQERFDAKYVPEPNSGCWLWTGCVNASGYGMIAVGNGVARLAHRISWEMKFGRIEDEQCALHSCDVRCCVNPDHLFLGTRADNNADMHGKGRYRRPARPSNSRLTDEQVVDIRTKRMSANSFARIYHVDKSTVFDAQRRKTWRNLP